MTSSDAVDVIMLFVSRIRILVPPNLTLQTICFQLATRKFYQLYKKSLLLLQCATMRLKSHTLHTVVNRKATHSNQGYGITLKNTAVQITVEFRQSRPVAKIKKLFHRPVLNHITFLKKVRQLLNRQFSPNQHEMSPSKSNRTLCCKISKVLSQKQ